MRTRLVEILCCPSCHNPLQDSKVSLECSQCKVKIPVIDSIPRFYQTTRETSIEFDETSVCNPSHWTSWRRKNYDFFQNNLKNIKYDSAFLDIGAGTSPFAKLLEPFKPYKVDFKPYKGIDFLTDLNKPIPVSDGTFDVILMSNLLEHMPEPLALLGECHRILKQGGVLLVTVPFLIKIHQAPYDFLRYTEFMLERLFSSAGFQHIRIEKIGNIFDVHSQVFSSLYKPLYRSISQQILKRKLLSLARRVHDLSIRAILKLSNFDFKMEDTLGYPHGYGCKVTKKESTSCHRLK